MLNKHFSTRFVPQNLIRSSTTFPANIFQEVFLKKIESRIFGTRFFNKIRSITFNNQGLRSVNPPKIYYNPPKICFEKSTPDIFFKTFLQDIFSRSRCQPFVEDIFSRHFSRHLLKTFSTLFNKIQISICSRHLFKSFAPRHHAQIELSTCSRHFLKTFFQYAFQHFLMKSWFQFVQGIVPDI